MGVKMIFLNQCRKYKTFLNLKYSLNTTLDLGAEVDALGLGMALIDYNYQSENVSLEAIKNQIVEDRLSGNFETKLNEYIELLKNTYYEGTWNSKHKKLVEIIKLNTNATFYGKIYGHKAYLTKDTYTIEVEDNLIVAFNLLDGGGLLLNEVRRNGQIKQRSYLFNDLNEFNYFVSNITENIEIDDKVLKMALI